MADDPQPPKYVAVWLKDTGAAWLARWQPDGTLETYVQIGKAGEAGCMAYARELADAMNARVS